MKHEDLPATTQAAELASDAAQRRHYRHLKIQFFSLVLAAGLVAWRPSDATTSHVLGFIAASSMFLALVAGLRQRARRYDAQWFACRAVAENTKSLMWQFAMATPAFPSGPPSPEVVFADGLKAVCQRFGEAARGMAEVMDPAGVPVSARMKALRNSSRAARMTVYRAERVEDQISWYAEKAKQNRTRDLIWSSVVIACEALAVVLAFFAAQGSRGVDFTGVLAALAAVVLAWGQARRFAELATSYHVAHQDLRALRERITPSLTDEEIASLVDAVEKAISREHGMWLARVGAPSLQL